MNRYLSLVINNPSTCIHKRSSKMHHNIHDKEQLNDHIEDNKVPFSVVSPEGHIIRNHDCNVCR